MSDARDEAPTKRLTRCFFNYGTSAQCRRPASTTINGKAYCAKHAAELFGQTLADRRLALNSGRRGRSGGELDRAVQVTIIKLLASATASLNRTKKVLFAERHPTVAERMGLRYRRGSLAPEMEQDWSVSTQATRGLPAYLVIAEHLRVLGGEAAEDGFNIPRPTAHLHGGAKILANLQRSIDAALADDAARRMIDELGNAALEPGKLERSLRLCQQLLHAYMPHPAQQRGSGRATNLSSDAAVVLLAGCWWLATGKWPPVSAKTTSHFYAWAIATLKRLNPEIASFVTSANALVHALRRHPPPVHGLSGPWIARSLVCRNQPHTA
jgi:hypothetical protein